MELWIRSQDGHKILKANEIYVCKHNNNHVYANTSIECGIELGNYATKQRALEILNEIQNKLNVRHSESISMEYIILSQIVPIVYDMPLE